MTALLLVTGGSRMGSRFLAALVGLISLRLMIYVLGFAGIYDDHPWVTFAPLDASLAFGPLLWLYVATLTRGAPPLRWRWHLVPAAIQLSYSTFAFALPLEMKLRWFRGPHLDWVEPVGFGALLVSCIIYLGASWRRQRSYQDWLDNSFSSRERWRLTWLAAILLAFTVTLLAAMMAATINLAVTPLNYFARVPVIFVSAFLAYTLGLLGWRNATLDLPHQPHSGAADQLQAEYKVSRPATAFGKWEQQVKREGWFLEEGLTLAVLASRLATSERTLSRALNEGAGCSFHDFINGLRSEAVMQRITNGARQDLLALALECGFSSKASFNRSFRRHTGMTPTQWKALASQQSPTDELARGEATGQPTPA